MHTSSRLSLLIALALGAGLSYGAGFAPSRSPVVMVNPQPLPPRYFAPRNGDAVNPQPLPPVDRQASPRPAGNTTPASTK